MLSESEKKMGWKYLFDGSTKQGWHIYNNNTNGSAWKVHNGMLYLDASDKTEGLIHGGGDLVTDEEYSDFHLKLEWKLGTGGNSGILFFVKEDPALERSWHSGPEMQLLDNAVHKDAAILKHRAGDLYDLISGYPETVNPAGEWNRVEIIVKDSNLLFRLNDEQILSTHLWDEGWKKLIAESKFNDFPQFGIHQNGHIVLQDHGDEVWFREVMIRKL